MTHELSKQEQKFAAREVEKDKELSSLRAELKRAREPPPRPNLEASPRGLRLSLIMSPSLSLDLSLFISLILSLNLSLSPSLSLSLGLGLILSLRLSLNPSLSLSLGLSHSQGA